MTLPTAETNILFIAPPKTSTDVLPAGFRLTRFLQGDTVVPTPVWTQTDEQGIPATDLTITPQSLDSTSTIVTALITGGVSGKTYRVYVTFRTAGTMVRTFGFELTIL